MYHILFDEELGPCGAYVGGRVYLLLPFLFAVGVYR